MPKAIRGALIECDPSIRTLIISIDMRRQDIIIEELDERHLFIDESKVDILKKELNDRLDQNTWNPDLEQK